MTGGISVSIRGGAVFSYDCDADVWMPTTSYHDPNPPMPLETASTNTTTQSNFFFAS